MNQLPTPHTNFRGYPVQFISNDCLHHLMSIVGPDDWSKIQALITQVTAAAVDMASSDEPSGWYFEADFHGKKVWLERAGGVRDERGHHGGYWSMFLPHER